jgi:hypothetical protein
MELLSFIALLVRLRWLVAVGAVAALGCAALASGKLGPGKGSAAPAVAWQLTAQAQIDTPQPLLADSHSSADAVQAQTVMLADYLTGDVARQEIARLAGLPQDHLTVLTTSIDVPIRPSPLVNAAQAKITPLTPYVVSALAWPYAPVISLVTTGPDERIAARLASSAMRVLTQGAGVPVVGKKPPMVVRPLGAARATVTIAKSHRAVLGVVAAVFVFGAWCVGLVLAVALRRRWRRSGSARVQVAAG